MKKIFSFALFNAVLFAGQANAQLYISSGSTFFIQPGGVVTVQGDVTGLTDIQGTGKILLKGSVNQNVNMNGFTVPNLEIDNTSNATLTGNTRIGSSLLFTNGKILAGNFNLNLADVATVSGGGVSKFVETAGTGQVIKELTANVTSSEIPVGAGTIYRPAFLTTSGTYSSANVGVRVLAVPDPNRPVSLSDYIGAYWPVTKTGITGTASLTGQYDVTDISGTESYLTGHYYTSPDWNSTGESHNNSLHQITAPIAAASGDLTAMDKFDLVVAKAFLQGTYSGSGVMADNLRTGTNIIPNAEPYRSAPYTVSFTHTNNPINENAVSSVFNDHANNDNIVDWVYLELRNNLSPGSIVLETRSALIQKDGDIVDVDGVSPVTFNRMASGNYTLVIRHRNHLGISTDPTVPHSIDEKTSLTSNPTYKIDFTATTTPLFGVSGAAYTLSADPTPVVLLWGGNAYPNNIVRFTSLNNDKDQILINRLGNNPANSTSGIYYSEDLNMNKVVRFTSLNNDKDFLLINVLGNNPANTRTQALPAP